MVTALILDYCLTDLQGVPRDQNQTTDLPAPSYILLPENP